MRGSPLTAEERARIRAERCASARRSRGPWPYDKRLRALGWAVIFIGVLLLSIGGFVVSLDLLYPTPVSPGEALSKGSFVFNGPLHVAIGVALLLRVARGTPARRKALRALCWTAIACAALLCAALYGVGREYVGAGVCGFVAAPAILYMERRLRQPPAAAPAGCGEGSGRIARLSGRPGDESRVGRRLVQVDGDLKETQFEPDSDADKAKEL